MSWQRGDVVVVDFPFTDYLLQDWRAAGLAQPSVLRSTLLTILASRITRKIGTLTSRDLQEASIRLERALEL